MKASHTVTRGCCCSRDQRDTHIQVQSSSVWECSLRATRIGECCEHLFPITSRMGGGDRPNSLSNNTPQTTSRTQIPRLFASAGRHGGSLSGFFLVLNLRRTHKAQFTTSSQVGWPLRAKPQQSWSAASVLQGLGQDVGAHVVKRCVPVDEETTTRERVPIPAPCGRDLPVKPPRPAALSTRGPWMSVGTALACSNNHHETMLRPLQQGRREEGQSSI